MDNYTKFKDLVDDLLDKDPTYKNEINNFLNFLNDRMLTNKVFYLSEYDIDQYFVYSFDTKIGTIPTLTTHIAALRNLFTYLIDNHYNFTALYGYINNPSFRSQLSSDLDTSYKKGIIPSTLLNTVLYRMDNFISENITKVFAKPRPKQDLVEVIIARLYAKLSLILPIKPDPMTELVLGDIQNPNIRHIVYNKIPILIPNSLRLQILESINYIQTTYGVTYTQDTKIFTFLYSALNKTPDSGTISQSFNTAYRVLQLKEMQKQRTVGKKDFYIYPAESYKDTAITNMLANGVNIVYLAELTDLDIATLYNTFRNSNFDTDTLIKSSNLNSSLSNTQYYAYL